MFRQLAVSKKTPEEIGILRLIMASDPLLEVVYLGVSAESLFNVAFIGLFLGMCCSSLHMACKF